MLRLIISLILICFSTNSFSNPTGDEAILDLSMASLACAAVQHINPNVVRDNYPNYFKNAVTTYSLYHAMPIEKAEKNERSLYNLMTGESAIKAQKLNSTSGAKIYLNKFLLKTDANSCEDTPLIINEILAKYGLTL